MKKLMKLLLLSGVVSLLYTACDKVDDLPYYDKGTASVLSTSVTTLAPPAADSNKTVLSLNWTYPNYATDSSNIKYVIEIDSAGKNFKNAASKVVIKSLTASYTAKELNSILLAKGYAFNVPVDMEVRVTSSYVNNNEQLTSNIVRIKMTPYKIPPKVALPSSLRVFIVGDATTFGWSNDPAPAFPPAREFARLDETTWGAIMYFKGSGAYKLLQTQGNWGTQYHMVNGGTAAAGSFIQEDADPGFPSPAAAGWYKVILDFQAGTYTVTAVSNDLPQELYLTGDAMPSGWTNAPPVAQQLTRLNSSEYSITIALAPGKVYKFLSIHGQWQPQFGGSSATGGPLGANYGGGNDPDAVPTPSAPGTYKIKVNFVTNTYMVTL
jgi:hypothetical protein